MAEMSPYAWRTTLTRRVAVAAAVLLLWSVAIEARLVYLQVIKHAELAQRAARQERDTHELQPTRGDIVDRHGLLLAYSVEAASIHVNPRTIGDPATVAAAVCDALRDCSAADRRGIAAALQSRRAFAWLRRQVTPEQAARVAALGIDGIGFVAESRRWYPHKELGAHVLGVVGTDHKGLEGIEARYESIIRGEPGTVLIQQDAHNRVFSRMERSPTTGDSLELTIDAVLQHVAERELRAGVEEAGADGGSVVVMDPVTGEILAMASYPTFNPNAWAAVQAATRRNRATGHAYEPGSTFKVFPAGAALEERVVTPADPLDVSAGSIRFGSRVIHDVQRYGVLSFEDVIVKSSNVGAIKVGLRLGADRMTEYVRRFGFGRPSSPDFYGENRGKVWDAAALNDSALASVSMGYQISATPLQMAAAFSAVANGGALLEPRLVRAVIRDGERIPVPRRVVDRPIGAATAAQLTTMMEGVVARGTARRAEVPGYAVAGKTGTAQKFIDGRYSRTDYNVSFAGYVPSRRPAFTIVVVIDTPRGPSRYGGVVAAPVFQRIAAAALRQYRIPPTLETPGTVTVVHRTDPAAHAGAAAVAIVPALDRGGAGPAAIGEIPDLTGRDARDAGRMLARLGVTPLLFGDGVVVDQQPAPGTPLDGVHQATLWLERQSPARRRIPAAVP